MRTAPGMQRRAGRATVGRVAVVVALASMGALWLYALVLAPRPDPPDTLHDPAFAAAAEPICAATRARLDELPLVSDRSPADELVAVVDHSNEELRAMVDDLRHLAPSPGDGQREVRDGDLVGRWLDDWEVHLADRQAWADEVRDGDVGPFTETDRGGEPLSRAIDNLAEVNDMASCATP